MRILFLGSNSFGSLESYYIKHLSEAPDIKLMIYPCHDIFYAYYKKSIINKILYKIGLAGIYKKINQDIIQAVVEFSPDVVLVFKGMEIFPATLSKLRQTGIKLVNYNPDHPFIFFGSGTGNENVKNSIGYYDLYLTYSYLIQDQINSNYNVQTDVLPFGYENICESLIESDEEINKLCFIGNPDKERSKMVSLLADNNIPIDVYGNDWKKWLSKKNNIEIFSAAYDNDFINTAKKYRAGLNLFRPHNVGSHNMRSFELFASGCIQLLPFSEQQSKYFTDYSEVFFYRDEKEMILKAKELLSLSCQRANEIRCNAINRCEKSEYSYKARTYQLIQKLKELVN